MGAAVSGRARLFTELISGVSGLLLALFMWGHVLLVGSILTGERGFDWLASTLEEYYIAQPTVLGVFVLFAVHAWYAARKIPAGMDDRRRMLALADGLRKVRGNPDDGDQGERFAAHRESFLWIWQVRTGWIILVLASFHIMLLGLDVLTPLFGEGSGIEASTTLARVQAGLWLPYGVLLLCVEFHASVGLYRLAIKWGAGRRLSRRALHAAERLIFWVVLVIGLVTLAVLGGVLSPPLAGFLPGGPS